MVDRQWALRWNPPIPAFDQWRALRDRGVGPANPPVATDTETTTNQQAWFDAPGGYRPQVRNGTMGAFGTSYADPGGGWNPISLLDARDGYDGTAIDGWYDAGRDRSVWTNNGRPELDRARVWRWTMDDLGGDFSNEALVKQTFLKNVARLKRDYNAPENRQRGLVWENSAFAGYDRMPGATGAQGQQASAQAPPAGQPPPVPPPPQGQQPPAGQQQPRPGSDGRVDLGNPGDPDNPQTGEPGYGGFFYQQNPKQAVRDYMNQKFGAGAADSNAFFGDWIKGLMGNLIPVLLNTATDASGKPALDRMADLPGLLDSVFFGGQGSLGANLRGWADTNQANLMGSLSGLDADTQGDLLRNLTALRTVSMNPYFGNAVNNRLDAAIGAAQDAASRTIRSGGQLPSQYNLYDFIQSQLPSNYVNPFRGY